MPIFMLIKTNTAKIHDKKPIIKHDFINFDSEMFLETISNNFNFYLKLRVIPVRILTKP